MVESYRAKAFDDGWLVRQSQSPRDIPVYRRGEWVLLDDEGFMRYAEEAS
ncbi:hypothetical protein [Mycolicibacterium fortuitum]